MLELEWWEAALLALVPVGGAGIVGITTALLTHWLTTSSTLRAEEQVEKRKIAEEERTAIRAHRQERLKLVKDYLALARRVAVAHSARVVITRELSIEGQVLDEMMPSGDLIGLANAYVDAIATSSGKLDKPLVDAMTAIGILVSSEDVDATDDSLKLIQTAERAYEQHLVKIRDEDS